ncbi:HAMP domain-containing protein [Candidatus Methylopumilus planktonicus]|uniref:sensor histidine kinase n=1 Tax=Candidatus Methylopumilus planktonicus TaxID=1581557 RepID=UPI00111D7514|nr:ATP-binding protein [Candidatus Methylopumilus planktonicus]QDD06364.1 HAMP domain-containing protein [Candidatus Methylopumilus planktonicus]QDD07698.1 HAMP domain-containing protein [Candidatus Methylopumilus planktonicus]QDD09025.1 HAMP domain-containing protein [Candidatus Methylopumilus planktonicus]
MRYLIAIATLVGASLLFLLSKASSSSEFISGSSYTVVFILSGIFILSLIAIIANQIKKLFGNIKKDVMGSRLSMRLVISFTLMAVIPGLIVYLVSVNFLTRSIESWFNVKVESALDGGLKLGQKALDIMLTDLELKAGRMALTLSSMPTTSQYAALSDLREKTGVQDATIISDQGKIIAVSSNDAESFLPALPTLIQLKQAENNIYGKIEPIKNKGLYLRVLAPINGAAISNERLILQILQPVPDSLTTLAESVQDVFQDYQKLSYSRDSLKVIFSITLTLVLMLAILTAVAIGFLLSRKLSEPLALLAEGTKKIAKGNFKTMLPEKGKDELGVLVRSFNSMTRQLDQATQTSENNQIRLESARSYLETVLAHLSSGVIVINDDMEIKSFNIAASKILQIDLSKNTNQLITSISNKNKLLNDFVVSIQEEIKAARSKKHFETIKQFEIKYEKNNQVLSLQITPLPQNKVKNYVLMIDDITMMIQAQRDAAWSEVARRLAHEIKNPLTPIQLSAERIKHKLGSKLNKEDTDILDKAVSTIVNQVDAMKTMVNEFSEYARAPKLNLESTDINETIKEISHLFENSGIKITTTLLKGLPKIKVDVNMMRQVLINLIQNAQDAMINNTKKPSIKINTNKYKNYLILSIEDNGPGFSADILKKAFEPYVTSKSHGTGLGLAIVKKIIEEHEGTIVVENIKNGGANINIQLPISKSK